jgi:23S rRNA (uracil1939-C5)-methyltransferase
MHRSDRRLRGPAKPTGRPASPPPQLRRPGLHKGQRLTLAPTRINPDGLAALDYQGGEIVVWEGVVGEAAEVELRYVGQHRARARALGSQRPSPHRRPAPCPRFEACGSCPLMHLQPEAQHQARLTLLRDAMRAEGLEPELPTSLRTGPDGEDGYRHVVKLAVGRSDLGHIRVGAFRRGSHDIVAIPECTVTTDTLRKAMMSVAHNIIDLAIDPFEEGSGRGILRHVILRQSRLEGKVLCTFVAAWPDRRLNELASRVMGAATGIIGVWVHYNSEPGNAIFQHGPEGTPPAFTRLDGALTIEEEVAGERLLVGPGDFFQVNPGVSDLIIRDVLADFAPFSEHPAIDLYCGVGAFTLPLARQHGFAFGVEVVAGAVERARENGKRARLPVEFMTGQTAEVLDQVAKRVDGRAPVVVVDPARRGLEAGVVERLIALNPARIAYVACDPRSLARDLVLFREAGWRLLTVRAYDLFPQTAHLETVALLAPPTDPVATAPQLRRRIVRK